MNTLCGYQVFLKMHPDSEFTREARARIEALEWHEALNTDTIDGFKKFLEKYPESKFLPQAHEKVEYLEWQKVQAENSYAAYNEFMRHYPQSTFVEEAKEEILWKIVYSEDTTEAYQNFLALYPEGKHADEARNKIEVHVWNSAENDNTIDAYRYYLHHYPAGRFINDAERTILLKKKIANCKAVSRIMGNQIQREITKFIGTDRDRSLIDHVADFTMSIFGLSEKGTEVDLTQYVSTERTGEIVTSYFISRNDLRPEMADGTDRNGTWYKAEKVIRYKTMMNEGSTIVLRDGRIFIYADGRWKLCEG